MRALVPIKDIADDVCEFVGDSQRKFLGFVAKHCAIEYRDLMTYVASDLNVVTETFDRSHIIQMPHNYMYYTKIGIQRGDDIVFISSNEGVDIGYGYSPVICSQTEAYEYMLNGFKKPYLSEPITFYNSDGKNRVAYGSGVRSDGLYKMDDKEGVLYLGSRFPHGCKVAVEYVSDSLVGGIKMVPTEMYKCLFNYGAYMYYMRRGDGRRAEFKELNRIERYKLDRLYNVINIDIIKQIFTRSERLDINPQLM